MFDLVFIINYNFNMKSCCVIGRRTINDKIDLLETLVDLIEKKKVFVFNFGFYGEFNDLCYQVLLSLKEIYPQIKLVLYFLNNEFAYAFDEAEQYRNKFNKKNKIFPHKCFDEIIYLEDIDETKFKYACVLRNKKLIDESDFCLIYYRENYSLPNNRNSGTKIAYEYAKKQNKNFILI